MSGSDPATGPIPPTAQTAAGRAGAILALAPGTELVGAEDGGRSGRFVVRRDDGRLVRMPWSLYRVATLLDGTRDLAAVAEELEAEDGVVHSADDVRVAVERRLVPAGLVAPLPDGADPADPAPVRTPRPPGGPLRRVRPTARGPRVPLLAAAGVGLVLVVLTAALTVIVSRGPDTPAPVVALAAPAASDDVAGPPTLLGRVVGVPAVDAAFVDVGRRVLRVEVAGLARGGTPACAGTAPADFARRTLLGQEVTVVPDPTLPVDPDRRRAYLVLPSQLSYTDAALGAGWARAGEGRYRAGFRAGQADAERAGLGLWGPPCRPVPPPVVSPVVPPAR